MCDQPARGLIPDPALFMKSRFIFRVRSRISRMKIFPPKSGICRALVKNIFSQP